MRITVWLLLLITTSSFGREVEKVELSRLKQFEKGDWGSLSFGFGRWHGDYYSYDERIILQRLPDNRFLLSFVKDGEHGLPIAKRFLSVVEAESIRQRIADFHRTALTEDSPGEYTEMLLKVTKPDGDNCEASARFDPQKKTLADFTDYFEQLLKNQKSDLGGGDRPDTAPKSKSESTEKPKPESEGLSR